MEHRGRDGALRYPVTPRHDQVDDYHGVPIEDPYRWLEEDGSQTRQWIETQNELTFGFLEGIGERQQLRQRLTELWNYERFGLPVVRGGRYFYLRNDGLQNQSVLHVADSPDGPARQLFDPNQLSEDGTVALVSWVPSNDGRRVALGLSTAGSDWRRWRVLDVDSGQLLDDLLLWSKFSSVSWTADDQGFYYSRYDEPEEGETYTGANYYQKLYYHRVGTPQADDRLVYQRPDEKQWGFGGQVTEDGQYLIISVWRGTERKNQVFYKRLADEAPADEAPAVVELITGFDAQYQFLGNEGSRFWFVTNWQAPRRRVVLVDTRRPERDQWQEVIPERSEVLQGASLVGERLLARYLEDARSRVRIHQLDGRPLGDLDLPGIGTISGLGGRRDQLETFYTFTNFTTPGTIYRYDIQRQRSEIYRQPSVAFDPGEYETRQVFYASRDGTRVPMFITHRRGLPLDGQRPTILYGYGGFDISRTPAFSVVNLAWLELGGVYAVANVRGGGEYGQAWHEAGRGANKQNVFDDFVAAAEWLIDQRYTSPRRLAIRGGSNGGLLVAAAMIQRPELFAAVVPSVGVLDMLRYHRFTIGWAWVPEYGSADDPEQFHTLLAYSPLHNLTPGTRYPATLVMTGDHDDRVVPAHSFKFAAALQAAQGGPAPVLIRVETRAGHGAGTPTLKAIESAADMLAFLVEVLRGEPCGDESQD